MQALNNILETNANVITLSKPRVNNVNNVRATAQKLCDRFNDQKSFKFYCKVAWVLPEAQIWANFEQAQKCRSGSTPRAYFTFLCKLAMNLNTNTQ